MNIPLVLATNPILEMAGQIAAFVICLFLFIAVILAVVLSLVLSFGLSALRDQVEAIKKIRPYVDTINQETSEAVHNNALPAESANPVARAVASVPVKVNAIDQKVEQTSDRVAHAAIEFRARTEQVKMVARAFFLPGSLKRRTKPTTAPILQEGEKQEAASAARVAPQERPPEQVQVMRGAR